MHGMNVRSMCIIMVSEGSLIFAHATVKAIWQTKCDMKRENVDENSSGAYENCTPWLEQLTCVSRWAALILC